MTATAILSTADHRKPIVARSAMHVFAKGGYHGTTVADVARQAKISPAYVFKLFPSKEHLFIAALELCFEEVVQSLRQGADQAEDTSPAGILDAMGGAYAELVADRTLLLLQVHAQSVSDEPHIGRALREGLAKVTAFAKDRSGANDADVQRFIAYGQLCHLIVTAGIDQVDEAWAHILVAGIRHPDAP